MRVFVCGGTGFVGSAIVQSLLADGHQVVGLTHKHGGFERFGGRIAEVQGDIAVPLSYRGKLLDCTASVNAVGLLRQRWDRRGVSYARVVVRGTQSWVQECREAGVKHLILVSANGADPQGTRYQRSKWMAEQAVRNSGLAWTILRPSLVAGPGGFVEQMEHLMRLKFVPIFGRQTYFFEPVALGDVAAVASRALKHPKARNRVFHLGGPSQFTYREMIQMIAEATNHRPWTVPAPKFVGYAGATLLGWLPFFPATVENLKLLFRGNVCPEQDWRAVFGIEPTPFAVALRDASGPAEPAPIASRAR